MRGMSNNPHGPRRQRLLETMAPGALILPSAPVAVRNNDVEHEYRQNSDLFYVSGFDEPESLAVLRPGADAPYCLFVRPRDPAREVWDGQRAGVDGAKTDYGADQAFSYADLATELPKLLEDQPRVYYQLGVDAALDRCVLDAIAKVRNRAKFGVVWPTEIVEPGTLLHTERLVKDAHELDRMRHAISISTEAHVAAMAAAQPGRFEYEVEAVINGVFRRRGSERSAYGAIVGSGPNATVLHYRRNDRKMKDGELLLIDAGCEYGYYASDITRTFPVNGRFSEPQRRIYEVVLNAQLASIEATRPGKTLADVHDASVRVITEGLVKLGLIEGPVDRAIKENLYRPFYMHKTSHYIGMDVHDVGPYFEGKQPRPLSEGVVITIEPGIYIAEDAEVPEEFRGIGVRIEDDVLVTSDGHEVLSAEVPKSVADVERACAA